MSFLKFNPENINELVFEKRNKAYGAYAIRAAYHSTLAKASFISLSGLALLVFMIMQLYRGKGTELIKYNDDGNIPLKVDERMFVMTVEPPPTKPKADAPAPEAAPKGNAMATMVTDRPIEEDPTTKPVTNETMNNGGKGNNDSQGTSSTGTGTTAVTGETGNGHEIASTANDQPVLIPEVNPEYEGGMAALRRFLKENIVYPEQAKAAGVSGTVYVNFVINEDGSVSKVSVLKGIGFGCDAEAARVVARMAKWKAGQNAGHAVKVMFNIPIVFSLR